MLYQLPPVGNPVRLKSSRKNGPLLQEIISPYAARFFDSGTSALAASILAAIRIKKGVSAPEVLLPAYGCPDLVSAVLYAGANPVLVDLQEDRPWMDLEQVSAQITANTVAVIAASLCGIPERLKALKRITSQSALVLIEDSAQLFPGSIEQADWQGDLVVLSFGRGKPVSLLGGGAVLFRDPATGGLLPDVSAPVATPGQQLAFRIKTLLYNLLITPRWYWILQWFPFLHIGETRFEKLEGIRALDTFRRNILESNIASYLQQDTGRQADISKAIDSLSDERILNLPVACRLPSQQRLLRYPLLVDAVMRNRLYNSLGELGLGTSIMYPGILPAIPGLDTVLAGQGPFPVAERFAARLLTLPVHSGVRHAVTEKIAAQMRAILDEETV
jgi:dTDP-4-amino-4,6-dideoxygalactose transaminase